MCQWRGHKRITLSSLHWGQFSHFASKTEEQSQSCSNLSQPFWDDRVSPGSDGRKGLEVWSRRVFVERWPSFHSEISTGKQKKPVLPVPPNAIKPTMKLPSMEEICYIDKEWHPFLVFPNNTKTHPEVIPCDPLGFWKDIFLCLCESICHIVQCP